MNSTIIIIFSAVLILLILLVIIALLNRPQLNIIGAGLSEDFPDQGFSHRAFEILLQRYVNSAGQVDYESWSQSNDAVTALDAYLAAVSTFSPESTPERFNGEGDILAYWLYAYNATVIKAILARWPLARVTDVKAPFEFAKGFGFFYRQRYLFGGVPYSLHAVENAKIRAMHKDARIHFVLNCGSESCPALRSQLPNGGELENLLRQAALDFVTDERNVRLDHNGKRLFLSAIFKWFEKDFIDDLMMRGLPTEHGGIISYLASIAPEPLRASLLQAFDYTIEFNDYDWSLNKKTAQH